MTATEPEPFFKFWARARQGLTFLPSKRLSHAESATPVQAGAGKGVRPVLHPTPRKQGSFRQRTSPGDA